MFFQPGSYIPMFVVGLRDMTVHCATVEMCPQVEIRQFVSTAGAILAGFCGISRSNL